VTRTLRGEMALDVPIIALTAHALPDDRARAATVGFSAYLAKPVEPRAVVAEVRRWLGGGGKLAGE
jgi:CheY-like chemotaxis protein